MVKRSISGRRVTQHSFWNILGFNFYSLRSFFRDSLSARVLSFPGRYSAVNVIPFPIRNSHNSSLNSFIFWFSILPFFLYALMQPDFPSASAGFSVSEFYQYSHMSCFQFKKVDMIPFSSFDQGPPDNSPWRTSPQTDWESLDWVTICGALDSPWFKSRFCTHQTSSIFVSLCNTIVSSYDSLILRPVICCCWRLLYCRGAGRISIAIEESLPIILPSP